MTNPIDEARWREEERAERGGRRGEDPTERALQDAAVEVVDEATRVRLADMTPRELMELSLRIAAHAGLWTLVQRWAADVAPYVHPKLSSVTQEGADPDSGRSDEALREELSELLGRQKSADRARTVGEALPARAPGVGRAGPRATGGGAGSAPRTDMH